MEPTELFSKINDLVDMHGDLYLAAFKDSNGCLCFEAFASQGGPALTEALDPLTEISKQAVLTVANGNGRPAIS